MNTIYDVISVNLEVKEQESSIIQVSNPKQLISFIQDKIANKTQEHLFLVGLNTKNYASICSIVSVGTLDQSLIHPRDIFQRLILSNCSKFILAHNHPSSYVEPSQADLLVTKSLVECGKLMKIELVDHIIVSNNNYFSFRENDLI